MPEHKRNVMRAAVHTEDADRQLDVRGNETSVVDADVEQDVAVTVTRRNYETRAAAMYDSRTWTSASSSSDSLSSTSLLSK